MDIQELDSLIDKQLKILGAVLHSLPEREIHCTMIGDPCINSAMLALEAVREALKGDDFYLRLLPEVITPLR